MFAKDYPHIRQRGETAVRKQLRNMNLLERVKSIQGAEEALGLTLTTKDRMGARLPEGSRLLGYSDQTYFCYIEGYLDTVFAVADQPEHEWSVWPVAYNFREFIRLILACGCAELSARSARLSENEYGRRMDLEWRRPHTDLIRLGDKLSLTPIQNPYGYTRMIGQLIDCRRINRG